MEHHHPPYWCSVCQLDLQSAPSLAEHERGRSHCRKAAGAGRPSLRQLRPASRQLPALSEREFCEALRDGRYQRVVVLTGAGVSTSAGVPDFRSRGGLFEQIRARFGARWAEVQAEPERLLSRPFAVQHLEAWEAEVRPFLETLKHPGSNPTATHHFCAWLHKRGWLKRVYTQNVDGLHTHSTVGLPEELVCEVHGALRDSSIVLYGDPIPDRFSECVAEDFPLKGGNLVDLVLVLGTSLQVAPFCALPNLAPHGSTRVLVNLNLADCMQNNWTTQKRTQDHGTTDAQREVNQGVRIAKHKHVPLRQMWHGDRKAGRRWRQLLVEARCDDFIARLLAATEPSLAVEPAPEPEPALASELLERVRLGQTLSAREWAKRKAAGAEALALEVGGDGRDEGDDGWWGAVLAEHPELG